MSHAPYVATTHDCDQHAQKHDLRVRLLEGCVPRAPENASPAKGEKSDGAAYGKRDREDHQPLQVNWSLCGITLARGSGE